MTAQQKALRRSRSMRSGHDQCRLSGRLLAGPAAPVQARHDDPAHGAFKQPVGPGQSVIESGAFFEFRLVEVGFSHEGLGGLAAVCPQGVYFVCHFRRAPDRECRVASRHGISLLELQGSAIRHVSERFLGVCLTDTP